MGSESLAAEDLRRLHRGLAEPPPAALTLSAGPWRLIYTAGELRYISWGKHEVWRRIYVSVRDRLWNTVPVRVSDEQITQEETGFEIRFHAQQVSDEIDLAWQGSITGDARGMITYRMQGRAQRGFWRNRIGFCVLHPFAECAGQPCLVVHADGGVEEGAFPQEVAPHQPFTDIRAISHAVIPGVQAEVQFAGEVFEMEDQRNWTDASFKTYSSPLRLPYPVWLEQDTMIEQSVTLSLSEALPALAVPADENGPCITIGRTSAGPVPRLGLGLATDEPGLAGRAVEHLRRLRLAHLRTDLALDRPGWQVTLQRAAVDARLLGIPLEIALTLSPDAHDELDRLVALWPMLPDVWAWLVFGRGQLATPPELVRLARPRLQRLAPAALIGGGSDIYFAQLNRSRPPASLFDVLSYPITPQMHADDDDTLVESLAGQAETVRTARSFAAGATIAVSPVTFKPRTNPIALAAGMPMKPTPADPRQGSLLGAGWTAVSFKYLAESGADSVTYFETAGPRGIVADAVASSVFPVYHVLADIGDFAGGEVLRCTSSRPLQADAVLLALGRHRCLLMASFMAMAETIVLQGEFADRQATVRTLDEANAGDALSGPERYRADAGCRAYAAPGELRVQMRPYAVTRIDWDEAG